jgi:hypothetical protein
MELLALASERAFGGVYSISHTCRIGSMVEMTHYFRQSLSLDSYTTEKFTLCKGKGHVY